MLVNKVTAMENQYYSSILADKYMLIVIFSLPYYIRKVMFCKHMYRNLFLKMLKRILENVEKENGGYIASIILYTLYCSHD